jgi:DNA-binding NarL/FixJ family response regulator
VTLAEMDMTVVAIAPNADEGLAAARRLRPDVVLVDLGLPDRSGLVLGIDLLEALPDAKIVALTGLSDERAVREALRIGFHGYLTKQIEADAFRRALTGIIGGQSVFPQRFGRRSAVNGSAQAALLARQLTPREIEVLQLLAEGRTGGQIAARLHVSPNTVRTHVQGILSKLQVHSRLEAAAFAVRHDLVKVRT